MQNAGQAKHQRRVEYIPPEPAIITALAHQVCQELSKTNSVYADPDVVGGLASFLTFLADRLAKYATQGHKELLPKKHLK